MIKAEIIERVARERRVEQTVATVCKTSLPLHGDAADLAQMVYVALLEKPEALMQELAGDPDATRLSRYIAGIVERQIASSRSPFHYLIRRPRLNARPLAQKDEDIDNDTEIWLARK